MTVKIYVQRTNLPPERSQQLQSLGFESIQKYGRTGAVADLEAGIQLLEDAFDQAPEHYGGHESCQLITLGNRYGDKYKTTGSMTDLETTIRVHQKAFERTAEDHPNRVVILQNLGIAYGRKYRSTGAMADLDRGLQLLQEALDIATDNPPLRESIIHNLGASYGTKYQKTGAMVDLEASIQHYRKALDMALENDESRGDRLVGLGTAYMGKYGRTQVMADLECALQHFQEALDLTPPDDPNLARRLLKIAIIYHDKFHKTGATEDLEKSIQMSKEALDSTRDDLLERTNCLNWLGIGYFDRFRNQTLGAKAIADLNMAIQRHEEALAIAPEDFVLRAAYLSALSRAYGHRFMKCDSWADWEKAVQKAQEALDYSSSPVIDRVRPVHGLLVLYTGAGKWLPAYHAASTAMSLIPLLTPRSLQNSDKQYLLAEIVGLASQAAAVALMAGKTTFDAIRLLEQGRGVILSSLHEIRTDISDLQLNHPHLAEDYIKYRSQLDAPEITTEPQSSQRQNADQKLEQVIQCIRRMPRFERFLLAPSEDQLMAAAARGPIVVINVNYERCDALIIENKQLRTLPLPRLSFVDVLKNTYTRADPKVLEWMWEAIAEPVLVALGFIQTPPDGKWPRIWWVPTGPLAKFPIHAAGRHADGSCNTVLDRAISSYSSSVRALIYSRQKHSNPKPSARPEKVVLVSMQHTPGQRPLLYALKEIQQLEDICKSMQLHVHRPQPYHGDVLPALQDCRIFHFAGHGDAHPLDPAKSSLLLHDGPLTVEDLLDANFRSHAAPFLAFLSACGTGHIRHDDKVDEGLHLISACQLAGFQHAIGTLWEVDDERCVVVTTMTYGWMQKRGISDDSVSEGLHHAIRSLRDEYISRHGTEYQKSIMYAAQQAIEEELLGQGQTRDPRKVEDDDEELTPLHWVPYVHFGI